jgi:enamine deaminase RidA (YjgF/YER057c/UK114 family)
MVWLSVGELPTVPAPQGEYLPAVRHGALVLSAGMTPRVDGELSCRGLIGHEVSIEQAQAAARIAAHNALSAVADAAGGLDGIVSILRLQVYLACADGFTAHSRVADAASALLREKLGERGRAARSAIGVTSLPGGAPLEIDLTAVATEA